MEYQRVMNDYKELIGRLKALGEYLKFDKQSCVYLAADAIEQLVKERDTAVADIEEVIHDDFGEICTICNKYKSCMKTTAKNPLAKLPCESGKWRGVKEK